jgi:hypothetical protein
MFYKQTQDKINSKKFLLPRRISLNQTARRKRAARFPEWLIEFRENRNSYSGFAKT